MTINLTNPVEITKNTYGGDTLNEFSPHGGCARMDVDFNAQMVTFTVRIGTAASGSQVITPGDHSAVITLQVNLATGDWQSYDNLDQAQSKSGTLSQGGLVAFVNQLKSSRNTVEAFVAGPSQILPGVQVAWP